MESKKRVSKLLKKHFKSIKIFFPDFLRLQGWVGGSDQIWKIPDFFFLNPSLTDFLRLNLEVDADFEANTT